MTRISDLIAAEQIARHCTDPRCQKCAARSRWIRRKSWRSCKSPTRRMRGRKR